MTNNICTVCGAGVNEDKKFCTECGTPVQGTDAEGVSKPLAYSETAANSIPSVQITPPPPVGQQAYQPPTAEHKAHNGGRFHPFQGKQIRAD